MWQSYKDDANAMRCIMSVPGWKPSRPASQSGKDEIEITIGISIRKRTTIGRWARLKARLIGKLYKLFNLKGGINAK